MSKKSRELRVALKETRQTQAQMQTRIAELEAQLAAQASHTALNSTMASEQSQKQTEFLMMLLNTTQDAEDLQGAIEAVLRLVCQYTGWDYGGVWIPNLNQTALICSPLHYVADADDEGLNSFRIASLDAVFNRGIGLIGRVWAANAVEWIPDVTLLTENEFVRLQAAKIAGLHGIVGVPISAHDNVLAVLCFATRVILAQDDQLVRLIAMVAKQVSSIIQRQQNEQYLKRFAQRMELLHQIDIGLLRGDSIQELIQTTLTYLRQLIPCQRAKVGVIDPQTGEGTVFTVNLEREVTLDQGVHTSVPSSVLADLDARYMRVFDDIRPRQATNPTTQGQELLEEGIISGLQVMLMNREQLIGSLGLLADSPAFFTPEYQAIAYEVAGQLAVALQQLRLTTELNKRILDLQAAQETQRQSEAHYRQVVEDQTEMICRYNTDFRLTFVNRAYAEYYGKPAQDLLGYHFLSSIPEEQRERAKANVLALNAANPVATSEHETVMPDHSRRWFQWTDRALVDEAGHVVEYQGVGRDITDRVQLQMEQQQHTQAVEAMQMFLQSTLDSFPANAAVLATDGTIINVNAPWRRFAEENGASSAGQFVGDNYLAVCDKVIGQDADNAASAAAGIRAVIAGHVSSFYLEYACHSPTVQRWFRMGVTPFEEVLPRRVVIAHIDITERKQVETALQSARDTLEQRVIERTKELEEEKGRIEAILDNSFDGILLVLTDLSIQRTNKAFDSLFLYAAHTAAQQSLLDLIHPSDRDRVHVVMTAVIAKSVNKQFEAHAVRCNGSTFEAEISVSHIEGDGLICIIRDITEQKRAQTALAEERNLLRTLIDSAPDFIYMKDNEHRFVLGNLALAQARGAASPEELVGKTDFDYFPPELAAQFHADEDEVLRTGTPLIDHEQPSKGFVGGFEWASSNKVPMRNLKGELLGLVGITRNITERKKQERQLRYHASLQENVSDAVITADTDFIIQSWNRAAERIYGWTAEEVIGKPVTSILPTQFESDEERDRTRQEFLERGNWSGDFTQHRKDGSEIYVRGSTTLFKDDHGIPFGIISVNYDITERKQYERQLRYHASLQENVTDAIISKDADSHIQTWNQGAENTYGWRADEVIGKTTAEVLRTHTVNGLTQEALDTIVREKGRWRGEVIQTRKDGTNVFTMLSLSLLKDEHNRPIGMVGVNVDITERIKAEQALQTKMAEEREFQAYLKGLHETTIELTQIDDLDVFYKRAVELGLERLGLERLALFLYDAAQGRAVGTYGTDSEGNLNDEHQLQYVPEPNSIEMRAWQRTERIALDEDVPLYTELDPIGTGWNAAAVLWNGEQGLGWLIIDNAITHAPASKAVLDILALYALALGSLLAHKQIQLSLRESEARYRLLAENATDVVMRMNIEGGYEYVSPSSKVVLGYAPEELLTQNALNYAHADDVLTIQAALQAAISSNAATVRLESRYKHKQGHDVWLESLVRAIYSHTGTVQGFIASSRDITERKQAEIALRNSEEKFRMLMAAAPIAVVITDQHGMITLVNHQAERLFGYTQPEFVGQSIEVLIPDSARSHHVQHREAYYNAPRMRRMGAGLSLFAKRKDGTEFPVEIELSFIQSKDDLMVMSFVLDITQREETAAELEQQRAFLREVIDVSPSMIFVKDYNARFILVNPMVAKVYNTTVEALIGKSDADFNPSQTEVASFIEADRRVIDSGETLHVEETVTDANGVTRWFQTTKVPIISSDGNSKYVLGVSTDITERKKVEETLRAAVLKEKELGDLKTRFVSMASHEFRTPLATILALTDTVITYRARLSDEQIEQRLHKIQAQIWHLRDIIEDVLQLARIQARRVEFNPVLLDLDSLCRSVVDEFESKPDFEHHIQYTCDTALHEVKLDRRLMRQVISNLVSNAIKYSPQGKIVTLNMDMHDEALVLQITDEGIGIPEADLKYLFEPFHRAANVGTIPGTGLGLVITKESIELHGGTIEVTSQVDKGTTFTVKIPIGS
ncbi:MAG: PAS domain S-box protein [Anaerolineae bacterium]|nr:PAS domain S-box protein [Anaerolineae bacterium]